MHITKHIAVLPDRQAEQSAQINQIQASLEQEVRRIRNQTQAFQKQLNHLEKLQDIMQGQLALLDRSISEAPRSSSSTSAIGVELFASDHLMDIFYAGFEDKFRGDEAMVMERLEEYLPLFKDSEVDFSKKAALDIGCGRGEMLQLLKKHRIKAMGLDINHDMVKRAKAKGLDAKLGDALEFLDKAKSQHYGAITGFHLVEHIPFNILLRIFKASYRALEKNGFVVFETPNPENIFVATHNFYLDPSHLHPLPPILLAYALEVSGFRDVTIKRLHPDTPPKDSNLSKDLIDRFYGARDYAVIGYR